MIIEIAIGIAIVIVYIAIAILIDTAEEVIDSLAKKEIKKNYERKEAEE